MSFNPRLNNTRLLVTDSNFEACVHFYRNIMGFELPPDDHCYPYVSFKVGGETMVAMFDRKLMAQAIGTDHLPVAEVDQDRVALIFEVDSVDEAFKELSAKGVEFVTEPQNRDAWMIRTAHLRDPDGNLIELYQDMVSMGTTAAP